MLLSRDAQGQPVAIRREDYAPPAWWIDTVDLTFDLDPAKTRVLNRMQIRRNADLPPQPLRLDGDELNLARVLVNGQGASFRMEGEQLVLDGLPDSFELEIFTTCAPARAADSPSPVIVLTPVLGDAASTSCPLRCSRATTLDPISPVPPMTTIFMVLLLHLPFCLEC